MTGDMAGSGWPLLAAVGCASGLLSGLLGIGGGLILVPALIFSLPSLGIDGPDVSKIAMATSLALVIPTSLASAQAHHARGALDWEMLSYVAPGILIGAMIAPLFAHLVSAPILIFLFVAFSLYAAWDIVRPLQWQRRIAKAQTGAPGILRVSFTGVFGGALSALLGLGVSWIATPIMTRFVAMPRAIGTSAALCVLMAAAGIAGHVIVPTPEGCLSDCWGLIYLPAIAAIGISAVLAAPIGVRLTHLLPVGALRRLFGLFLIGAAASLAYKSASPLPDVQHVYQLARALVSPPDATGPVPARSPEWLRTDDHPVTLCRQTASHPQRAPEPLVRHTSPEVPPIWLRAAYRRESVFLDRSHRIPSPLVIWPVDNAMITELLPLKATSVSFFSSAHPRHDGVTP